MNLQEYLDRYKSQREFAEKVGVSQSQISLWKCGKLDVPVDRIHDVVMATGGAVTARELRPDLYKMFVKEQPVSPMAKHLYIRGNCPCGWLVTQENKYCPSCGKKLSWAI